MTDQANKLSSVLVAVSIGLVGAAVSAFYLLPLESTLYRALVLVLGLGIAAAVFFASVPGRSLLSLSRESGVELRKVHWPSKQETYKTSGIVLLVVLVMAILLWLVDLILSKGVSLVIGA